MKSFLEMKSNVLQRIPPHLYSLPSSVPASVVSSFIPFLIVVVFSILFLLHFLLSMLQINATPRDFQVEIFSALHGRTRMFDLIALAPFCAQTWSRSSRRRVLTTSSYYVSLVNWLTMSLKDFSEFMEFYTNCSEETFTHKMKSSSFSIVTSLILHWFLRFWNQCKV